MLVYPAEKVGYDGICPSLRLKAVRDAIEDYEYLAILDGLGRRAEALQIVAPLADSFTSHATTPRTFEQARIDLVDLIVN